MTPASLRRWCTFLIGEACFAIDSAAVIEVLRDRGLTRVPLAASGVLGLAHLRGRIVPVVDPAGRLGVARGQGRPRTHLIVALGDDWYGLLVDEMLDVIEIPAARIERPTAVGGSSEVVTGTFAAEQRLVHLLDPERMIHSLVRQAAHHAGRPGGPHGGTD
jgi:chemotaxis signal transduction protein